MELYQTLPFELGQTIDSLDRNSKTVNADLLGRRFYVPANKIPSGPTATYARRTGDPQLVVVLYNASGATLKGSRVGTRLLTTAGVTAMHHVAGYANTLAKSHCVIIDEFLGANGVPDKHYFAGVIGGPVQVRTSGTEADFNGDWAVGDWLVSAATGASLTDDDGGRAAKKLDVVSSYIAGDTALFDNIMNRLGYTLEAADASEAADQSALKLIKANILY